MVGISRRCVAEAHCSVGLSAGPTEVVKRAMALHQLIAMRRL